VAAVKDRLCEKGIEMSKEPSACSRSSFQGEAWETQLSKVISSRKSMSLTFTYLSILARTNTASLFGQYHNGDTVPSCSSLPVPPCVSPVQTCCDCCMLGLVTASRGLSCELEGLMMGRKCMHTARDCCAKNTTVEIQPAAGKKSYQCFAFSLLCPLCLL